MKVMEEAREYLKQAFQAESTVSTMTNMFYHLLGESMATAI